MRKENGPFIYDDHAFYKTLGECESRPEVVLGDKKYTGEWKKGTEIIQGKGVMIWKGGSIHEGYWKDSKANGKCASYDAGGDLYIGEFKKKLARDQGKSIMSDVSSYIG